LALWGVDVSSEGGRKKVFKEDQEMSYQSKFPERGLRRLLQIPNRSEKRFKLIRAQISTKGKKSVKWRRRNVGGGGRKGNVSERVGISGPLMI